MDRDGMLLVEADASSLAICEQVAETVNRELFHTTDVKSALDILREKTISIVLLDAATASDVPSAVRALRGCRRRASIVVLDAAATVPASVKALRAGAFDYRHRSREIPEWHNFVRDALEHSRLEGAPVLPLQDLEREAICVAMSEAGGDKMQAARMLAIGKTTLYRKLRLYGVHNAIRHHRRKPKALSA